MSTSDVMQRALKMAQEDLNNYKRLTLKERVVLAKEFAAKEEQLGNVVWGHQKFAMTIGELLDAAERGA